MPEIVLGGVQFGLAYGISNQHSLPISITEAGDIISYAKSNGITKIDTACAYGNSEALIGSILESQGINDFNIITKILPFFTSDNIYKEQIKLVEESFIASLVKLHQKKIYGLMIHHADDLLKPGGDALYQLLLNLKQQGLVNKIGCSFYYREQMDRVLNKYSLDMVQVPASIFDQRLLKDNYLSAQSQNMEVYVRSLFLQGLIFLNESQLPENIKFAAAPYLKKINAACNKYGLSKIELALAYFKDKDYLKLVIGVTSQNELDGIITTNTKISDLNSSAIDFDDFAIYDATVLNPGLWTKQ